MRIMPFMKRKKGVQFAGTGLDTGGVTDYDELSGLPQIGGVTLIGNKTLADLGAQSVLTFDDTPTVDSNNPVKSGGVYTELLDKIDTDYIGSYDATIGDNAAFMTAIFNDIKTRFTQRTTYYNILRYSRAGIYIGTMTFFNVTDNEYYISMLAHSYSGEVVHFGITNGTTFYNVLT